MNARDLDKRLFLCLLRFSEKLIREAGQKATALSQSALEPKNALLSGKIVPCVKINVDLQILQIHVSRDRRLFS